jgi:hypothetical protein
MKRAETEEHDMDKSMQNTLVFAKCLVEDGNACGTDSDTYHQALEKLALASKGANESLPKAYTRVATTTEQGRLLFKAAMMAPKPKQAPQDLVPRNVKPAPGPASEEMNALARRLARERRVSFQQAYTRLLTDPDEGHAELAARVRDEERRASAAVRDARDPIWTAERQYERNFS